MEASRTRAVFSRMDARMKASAPMTPASGPAMLRISSMGSPPGLVSSRVCLPLKENPVCDSRERAKRGPLEGPPSHLNLSRCNHGDRAVGPAPLQSATLSEEDTTPSGVGRRDNRGVGQTEDTATTTKRPGRATDLETGTSSVGSLQSDELSRGSEPGPDCTVRTALELHQVGARGAGRPQDHSGSGRVRDTEVQH